MCIFTGISDSIFMREKSTILCITYETRLAHVHLCTMYWEAVWICFWQQKSKCYTNMKLIDWLCLRLLWIHCIWIWFSVRLPITNAWHCHSLCAALSSNVEVWEWMSSLLTLSFISNVDEMIAEWWMQYLQVFFSACNIFWANFYEYSWNVFIIRVWTVLLFVLPWRHSTVWSTQTMDMNKVCFRTTMKAANLS